MIYNQINLPLSFRKVIKKSISSILWALFAILLALIFTTLFKNDSTILGQWIMWWLIVGAIIILAIGHLIYQYLYYKTYAYEFGYDGASITKGVISRATGHIQYKKLQNIYIDQDIWDRVFGLYDVHYETAGETSGFYSHVDGLNKENSDKLATFLIPKSNGDSVSGSNVNNESVANPIFPISQDTISQKITHITRNECPISRVIILVNSLTVSLGLPFIILLLIFGKTKQGISVNSIFLGINTGISEIIVSYVILFLIFFIIYFIYYSIWYKNFYFSFEAEKGEIRKKVIGQSISYLYYNRIQNINISQGILDRIFGIFSLNIETAGENSGYKLSLSGLSQEGAERIREFLLERTRILKNTL